ncbi:MAG: hypothetical protein EPO31_10530 [Gammaproteobacteria bacterium]|jgi:uncharacterized protein (TIGR02001 family)|nr:MAG: hypothetical protein EPO31_10530 [Gammaproteobacteria bacterium]
MKKSIFSLASILTLASAATVSAQESPHSFSANVALTTDYMFRGYSQSDEGPAIQGGFDYVHESGVYLGTWASSIDFAESSEIDLYGGISGELANGLGWDVGGLYYLYPGDGTSPEFDFFEVYGSVSHDFEKFNLAAGLNYSPDYTLETGDGIYVYGDLGVPLPHGFNFAVHVGHQSIEDNAVWGGPDYLDWKVGVSKAINKFNFDLSYVDTDLNDTECNDICDAVVFTISSSF